MLVTTVTAMATDYVADCVVSCNNQESTMSGATMSVVDNGDGTYNITLKALKSTALGMDFGDLTLSNLSGTTEGGVTTISVAEVNAKFTSGDYMEAPESPIKSFVCKFNAEKLYANYGSGSMLRLNNWQRTAFTASFGTDEGFESTGGGSTGGEDKPAIVTVKENFQSTEGSSWGENVTIDWNTQKLVASINLASTGSDKGFLGVTKKGQTAGWNNYGIIFYNTNGSTVQGYAPGQPNNANTDQVTKGEDPVRFEISKDGGVKCQGNVVISASNIAHLTNQSEIVVGAADKPAGALYNYIKVVPLDWTEPTTPDTPMPVVYNNTLKVVRGTDTKTYEDAPVSVIDEGEGKYTVTIPSFSDMDSAEGTTPGTIGKLTFVADGVEADGKLKLTASSVETTQEGGEGWESQTFTASMDATVTGETLAGTFTVKVNGYESMYTYNLYYGVEAPEVVTEVANNNYTSNLRIIDQTSEDENTYLFQTDEASVNIIKYSDHTYKITLRNITLNEKTSDLVFTGAEVDSDEGGAVVTDETMVRATADAETQNFLGGAVVAQFMWQDVSATEIRMSFVLEGTTLSLAGEFNYEEETPDQPKDDYAINFDKDAKQNHSSRYSTSVSLQQTGKDKQTIEFGKTMNGYEDLTTGTEKFTVEAGSEVTPSIGYVGEWMHGYVYIDLDNNKQFSFNADGADQTGTEVVSYSYYKDQNSKGESASSNCNVNPMPAFTAPTTPGTYRIRFKVDWDNIDAGGSVATGNSILNNGGGIYDATLEVVEPVTDGISTINAEVANGEAQLFTVDGVQIAKLQKGLNIVRTADGKVKKVLVK